MDIDYAQAIQHIGEGTYDREKVCLELAKQDPALFNEIVSKLGNGPNEEERIVLHVFDTSRGGSVKIDAIRAHRHAFKSSLKEAKERVESIMSKYKLQGPNYENSI